MYIPEQEQIETNSPLTVCEDSFKYPELMPLILMGSGLMASAVVALLCVSVVPELLVIILSLAIVMLGQWIYEHFISGQKKIGDISPVIAAIGIGSAFGLFVAVPQLFFLGAFSLGLELLGRVIYDNTKSTHSNFFSKRAKDNDNNLAQDTSYCVM